MWAGSSKACLRALPDSQTIRSMISSWRSSTRSCSRSAAAARSATGVRAQAVCARRARRKASATSASLDCGTCASGWPVSGEETTADSPDVATSRWVSAAAYSGSNASVALGSCSGSCGPVTVGSASCALILRA